MSRLICLSVMLGCTSWASAQVPDAVSEKDFLSDMPIVLSVSRLPQRLDETPGAVTILDRDMIRLSGARDVADLLRLVPGFQTSTSFETVAPLASYHGGFDGYSNRMQVLVDGRSVYSTYFIGSIGAGLQTVALTDIERIEVLRGSNSAAYGARAMLGVINIVTRHTVDTVGQQVALTGGENSIEDAQASLGWGKDATSFRLSIDRRADAGLKGVNGQNQVDRVNFRADLQPTTSDEIQFRAGLLEILSGKGVVLDGDVRDTQLNTGYFQFDWRRNLGLDSDLAFNFSHTQEAYVDKIAAFNIDYGGTSENDAFSISHTFRRGDDVRVVWGGELRREAIVSKTFFSTDAALVADFTRFFGNVEWRFAPDFLFNAGGLVEHSNVSSDSFSPRVMLNWHVTPGHTLRAGVSQATRPPSQFEKYANIPGFIKASGNVQSESVFSREIGYLGDFPALRMNLDVRIFNEEIADFIRQKRTPSSVDYVNDESFFVQGFEYQFKWRPWRDAQFIFNQSYIDINSKNPGSAVAAPKLASSLTYFQKLPGGLDLSLMHQDSGTAALHGADESSRVAMTRTDLRLGLPLRWGRNRGEVAVVVQNLGGPYADFSPNFHFHRRAFVTLRVEN